MKLSQMAVLGITLVFTLVNIMFVAISTLLIYSLLLVSVEKKTFDNGILRLVGLRKINFIVIILFQSIFFVIPSIIVGLILSIPSLCGVYGAIFGSNSGVEYTCLPASNAIVQAVIVGMGIPTLAAIVPIVKVLSKSLIDSIHFHRIKASGISVTIEDEKAVN